MEKRKLDMSLGNPLYPFCSAARYAFREATKDLHKYRFLNNGYSEPEILNVLAAIKSHFDQRKMHNPHYHGLGLGHLSVSGGGTTESYNLIIQLLIQDVMEENRSRQRNIKPAILMPVPTYGFFMEAPKKWGIEIITVKRDLDNKGYLDMKQIEEVIKNAHAKGLRFIAYYDSNPNNPMGTIRNQKDTYKIAQLLWTLHKQYKSEDKAALKKWQQTQPWIEIPIPSGKSYRHKPGSIWQGPASRIRIIDDMVYDGLEYSEHKGFAFAQIPELFNDTFTLFGPSKSGLANMRGGIVIGNDKDIRTLEKLREINSYFPTKSTLNVLEAFYSTEEPFASQKQKHMKRLNSDHRFHGLFMKALVNGLDTLTEATASDKRKITTAYAKLKGCTLATAGEALNNPVKDVRIITTPEAGFFHLLDFRKMKGHLYQDPRSTQKQTDVFEDDGSIIDTFIMGQNMGFCSANWMGMDRHALVQRVSFAIPLADILEFDKRLRQGIKTLTPASKNKCCAAANPAPTL